MRKTTKKINKLIKLLVALSILFIALTGCSVIERIAEYNLERLYEEKEEVVDNTLYLPESTYVKNAIELTMVNAKTLNPIEPIDYTVDQVLKLVYQSVLKLNEDSSLENGLVSQYEKISETVYRFTISDLAMFHNDSPVLTKDIKYSFDMIRDTIDSPYEYSLSYIEAITEINEKVFEVKFKTLDYFNLYSLTFPIISEEYMESDDFKALMPIGSGPYKYENFQSMLRFDLIRSDNYMYDKPKADRVTVTIIRKHEDAYNMFLSKRIDLHNPRITIWEYYADDQKIETYTYDSSLFYYIGINHDNYLLNETVGRQLVATTIPFESIRKDGFLDHLNSTILPIKSTHILSINMDSYIGFKYGESYFNSLYARKNLPKYMMSLRETGNYILDYSPVTLKVIYNSDNYYSYKIVQILEANQSVPQLIYNYEALDSESYKLALEEKNYDLFIGVIKTGIIPDLKSIYTTNGGQNLGGYSSINMNGLLSTYRKISNEEQFINQLENLAKVAMDELPIIPLGFLENGLFVHEFVGLGAKPNSFNNYNNLEGLEIIGN